MRPAITMSLSMALLLIASPGIAAEPPATNDIQLAAATDIRSPRLNLRAPDITTVYAREEIDRQYRELRKKSGLLGGFLIAALPDLPAILDELSEETGDGVVSLESARLEGVGDMEIIPVNHVELIRGPLLYPDSGPVACLPFVLDRLAEGRPKP